MIDRDAILRSAIEIDADLIDIVATFLGRRVASLAQLEAACERGDFEELATRGHNLAGTGGGYGFPGLSRLGLALRQAAHEEQRSEVRQVLGLLRDFLARPEVRALMA